MPEPVSSVSAAGAAGTAAAKYFGLQVGSGVVSAALGYAVLWPKTRREGIARLLCSVGTSIVFGPALVAFAHSQYPTLLESAQSMAVASGMSAQTGSVYAIAPILVAAGLPAWWIIGAVLRWFDKRSNEDIGELIADARKEIQP